VIRGGTGRVYVVGVPGRRADMIARDDMAALSKVVPEWMRDYKPSWLSADVIAAPTT
jgi:hypothetical protein